MPIFNTNYSLMAVGSSIRDTKEQIKASKSFFSKIGLKSDRYGWVRTSDSVLDLATFKTILEQATQKGYKIRLSADIQAINKVDSDWYLVEPYYAFMDYLKVPDSKYGMNAINTSNFDEGIYLANPSDLEHGTSVIIREDAATLLENNGINIVIGPWIPDISKFKALQFYYLKIEKNLRKGIGIKEGKVWQVLTMQRKKMEAFLKVFNDILPLAAHNHPSLVKFEELSTPFVVEKKDLLGGEMFRVGEDKLCVSKRIKEIITENKIISETKISPIITVDAFSDLFVEGAAFVWKLKDDQLLHMYDDEIEEKQEYRKKLYQEHLNTEKKDRIISQKIALNRLKQLKADSKNDFNVGAKGKQLEETDIEIMKPYYSFSNGFYVTSEYYIFSIEEQKEESVEFENDRLFERENGIEEKAFVSDSTIKESDFIMELTKGYKVIGKTADGDWLLILDDGTVVRYGLFDLMFEERWRSLHEFFFLAE